ncbi:MAG: serine/threonine protein kinase [Lentisphaeraceae bacterium]|nr:serine/threonine protein kinase [Lentisphaeraceae bacterium]
MSQKNIRGGSYTNNLFDSVSKLETVKANNSTPSKKTINENENSHPLYENLTSRGERYEDERFIAAGGEKAVFSVYDTYSCRHVALARPIFHRFESEKEQFIKEALICAKLQHPNIVPVYDVGIDSVDIPFFTMKLFVGDTLKDILKKLKEGDPEYLQNYNLNRLLIIFINICDAIDYAHKHNVIHCDIKPENIHIDKFGSVLIGDWGLSKIIPTTHANYNKESSLIDLEVNVINANPDPGSVRGTPGYLAPEILVGLHSGDVRSDLYSLGALLYELVSLNKPVTGSSPQELFENTKKHNIQPLSSKTPPAIKNVIMKTLSLDPSKRYRNVLELRTEVTNYLQGFATDAEKSSYLTLVRLMIHRNKVVSGIIAGFTILISLILASAYEQINTEKAEAEIKRDISEKNLTLLREINKKARLLSDNLSKLVQSSKYLSADSVKYRSLAQSYAINYESDPVEKAILYQDKAMLHYILQEFNQAVECLDKAKLEEGAPLYSFYMECKNYADLKPNDNELLSPEKLNSILENPYDTKLAMQLFYVHTTRASNIHPVKMIEPARKVLNMINNTETDNFTFAVDVDADGAHIDLSNAPYTDFILPIESQKPFNILSVFNPSSVNLSHSWITDLSKLRGLKLKEINISYTNLHKEKFWEWLKKLKIKNVTMTEGQFPADDIERYKNFATVSYEAR